MTVVLIDGFDTYNGVGANTGLATKWGGDSTNLGTGSGRFAGRCMTKAFTSTSTATTRQLPSALSSVGIGFAVKASALSAATMFEFRNSSTVHASLRMTATGALTVTGGAGTVLNTSASGVIGLSVWHYIEFGVDIHDSAGVINVKVDGVSIFAMTSQDTRNGATTTADNIGFHTGSASGGLAWSIDDLYVVDSATTLGERKIETLYPTSDIAQGFARSTGSVNFSLVDEALVNGDTDYVQGSAVNDVDTYGFNDLTGSPATIDAILVSAYAEKTDATSRSIALQVKSGATTSDGSNFALAASYSKFERLLLTDPNTAGSWSATTVNAVQGGPKVTV